MSYSYAYILRAPTLLGSKADPVAVLTWLFERNMQLRLPLGACRVAMVGEKVRCFYMLEPPEMLEPLSLGTMLWAGLCECCSFLFPRSMFSCSSLYFVGCCSLVMASLRCPTHAALHAARLLVPLCFPSLGRELYVTKYTT